jgi:hypothetical protein
VREAQRVVGDLLLDGGAHVRRGAEEPIGRHQSTERLVWTLKVVGLDEQTHATHAVGEVGKHGLREKLVPERLPETLNLAERLGMLRAALDVLDALAPQLLLELRLAAPRRVLPSLVRQDFARRPVVLDSATQCVHHELALLMMSERVGHEKA